MEKWLKSISFIFVSIVFFQFSLYAGTTGKIAGRVIDAQTKEALAGANVVILNTSLGASVDLDGTYYIINIPPGVYDIEASFIGYQTVRKQKVVVTVDRTTTVNFELQPTVLETEVVEVVAEREDIIRDLTATSQKVSGAQISQLPVEDLGDILSLQAGVTQDPGGGIHLRGGRSDEIQYYVDGIAVTNPFGRGLAVPVQNNVIQEMEVISGTFNAEYGQAMSGIVNIVTKEGGDQTNVSFSAYSGDFISTHDDVFMNIDHIDPLSQKYVEGAISGPVPLFNKRIYYFISGRFRDEENWLYGKRLHMPSDTADFTSPNPEDWSIQYTGDGKIIPMNPSREVSYQAKLTFKPFSNLKMSYNFLGNSSRWKNYDHHNKYNPEYIPTHYSRGITNLFVLTHTISASTFHEFRMSYYWDKYERHCRKDPFDPFYDKGIHKKIDVPQDVFAVGGVDAGFEYRENLTTAIKYDLVSQINKYNLIKVGVEYRRHDLKDEWFVVRKDEGTNWQLQIDDLSSFAHNYYHKKPLELAAYIQDKIEIEDLVVNAGIRFDYFDPNSKVPVNMTDPSNKRGAPEDYAYRDATVKTQISPRFGLAFPISDRGNIHVAYGHFFQIPDLGRLYENPEFEVIGRFESFIGNADLEPQRTTMYEIGLQQQLIQNLVMNVTCYFKDIRHLAGTKLYKTFEQDEYGQYANNDYGNVWGITASLDLRKMGMISANLDYTYQIAEGNGSDPKQAFYDARNRDESAKTLIPLDWDQRHVLNAIVTVSGKSWGISSISKFHTGFPYTPITTYNRAPNIQLKNEGRRKAEFNMDLRLYKSIHFGKITTRFFVNIENVFDNLRNEYRPEITERDLRVHEPKAFLNSLYEYRFNPASQPMPRLVKIGFDVEM
ncbi:TonB-dependent receptor [Calditrichota bacterium LG25]